MYFLADAWVWGLLAGLKLWELGLHQHSLELAQEAVEQESNIGSLVVEAGHNCLKRETGKMGQLVVVLDLVVFAYRRQ